MSSVISQIFSIPCEDNLWDSACKTVTKAKLDILDHKGPQKESAPIPDHIIP